MANEDHLTILNKGIVVWNQWRLDNPKIEPDLNEAQLNDSNLTGVNFSETMLVFANLSGANLSRSKLARADFTGANLSRVNLTRTNLRSTNLIGASLTGANLSNSYLGGLDFSGVLDLSEVDFSGANLWRMKAYRANLNGAILTGACIEEWQVSGASLDNVVCKYIYLQQDEMEPFEYSDRRPNNPKNPEECFAAGEFSRWHQEEQSREARRYVDTSIRFEKDKPDENIQKLVKLIGTATIEAIFDPYFDNTALDNLAKFQELGVAISSEIRILTSDKMIDLKDLRLTKARKEKTFQALLSIGEIRLMNKMNKEHRRFMLLSGGLSLIIGMSLHDFSKNEVASTDSDRDDRAIFDSVWSSAQVFG